MSNNYGQKIINAIVQGASSYPELMTATGLKYQQIGGQLTKLYCDYNVVSLPALCQRLRPPPKRPEFSSHNSVMVDKALNPAVAAKLLVDVLGNDYCVALVGALQVELWPNRTESDYSPSTGILDKCI